MKDKGEIIVYQSENTLQLEVRMEDETVWLTQAQMISKRSISYSQTHRKHFQRKRVG